MSTTAAATAAIASVQASNAQPAAKRAECELAMRGFENDGATLHARPLSP